MSSIHNTNSTTNLSSRASSRSVAGGKEQVSDKDVLDFVKHFDLPDENLRECITCSLKGGPNNGKLFLTNNYACYYGKKGVLKSDYKKVIPTDEVLDCDIQPGGIKIVTFGNKKYILSGFADEERAVRTMQRYIFGVMGNRPLHNAVLNADTERINLIIQSDPTKLNDFNREDETPLALAIKKKDEELVRDLLKHYKQHPDKANINVQDRRGFSIMHSAVMISDIPDAILLDLIQFEQTDCGIKNQDHTTPLHYFCEKTLSLNCPFIGRELIKKGGSVNAQSKKNGETPLHKAIFNNKVRLMLVEMLLGKGASPNATTSESGDTPLHYAVHLARVDLVETLIRGGADPACKNKAGKTPADLLEENMAKNPHPDLIKIKKTLADVQNLNNLLISVELESHLMEFIKDELFKPELLVLVDEDRLQNMGISLPGGKQVKFFKEIEVIKTRLAKEKEEQEKNAPTPVVGPGLTKTASAQEIKANVMAQSQDLTDNFKEKLSEVSGEIDANEIEYTKELGAGASGKVYKARWREKEVAVKVLSNVNMDAQIEEFKKEFKIMNAVKSPFMIQFYGASLKPLMMVMEFCARGSLYHVLNDKTLDINWERALNIAIEMANGIAVLHGWEPQIVHRDLKSLNLLVTSDWKIKVADFGLSRFTTGGNMETFKKLCGTFAYCAPEIFGGTSFTDKSDVYSMGMVIWELIVRVIKGHYEQPFSEYKHLQFDFQILVQAAQGLRPTLPDSTPAPIADVFKRCCDAKPENRPSAKEVVTLLETVKENFKQNQSAWDEVAAKKKA